MRITFSGANREVTGSCYHLETKQANVVVDCGMFQGGKFAEDKNALPFPFDPARVHSVILTHAHFDHVGRLPKLYKDGFRGKVYCTEPTAELTMLNLRDAVHLVEDEARRNDHEPLFGSDDVEPLEALMEIAPYHEEFTVAPGVTAFFSDAGHILGSASVKIIGDDQHVVFSGDLGNTPTPLLGSMECLYGANVIICESTYGNRVHEANTQRQAFIKDAILETVKNKGVLLIPSFAIERTQEILFELNRLHNFKEIPNIPTFLDSPLAIKATEVFQTHREFLNAEAKVALQHDPDIFSWHGLKMTEHSDESKAILNVQGPKIIIAGSGMMTGGRIMHHLKNYLHLETTTLLIVGFQVEGSLGRRLHDKEKVVRVYGEEITVKAQVKSCGAFSGHADYPRLMHWMHCFEQQKPWKVFITHGELNSALAFSQSVEEELHIPSGVPEFGEVVDLDTLTNAANA